MKAGKKITLDYEGQMQSIAISPLSFAPSYFLINNHIDEPFLLYLRESGLWACNNIDIDVQYLQVLGYHVFMSF